MGGGTPTQLSIPLLERLFTKITSSFSVDMSQEIAMEIDPRTVLDQEGEKLRFLRSLGYNRVSFGVQDTNPQVQEAVKRRQTLAMTQQTYALARTLGFSGINIDLIYGLPLQSAETFAETRKHILEMRPDRIAFFSYAQVPWLKPHQKAIRSQDLPTTEEKFRIYTEGRESFIQHGYIPIGMDHFSLPTDSLAQGYLQKKLQRNFQGYSLISTQEHLGFGVTAIGYTQGTYIQNKKELAAYYQALDHEELPVEKGKELTAEDHLRKWVIHHLMCDFACNKEAFRERFDLSFDSYFSSLLSILDEHERDGLLHNNPHTLRITPLGELFVRSIAATFDTYLPRAQATEKATPPRYSQAI
jgi:oxygen-independent coproporphyrinogen-3 oxidase